MSTTTTVKHSLKDKDNQPRQKRFKVGKACFTCRVKKIKCDGLQPCMQCKARSRPCSFSKDGTKQDHSPLSSPTLPPVAAESAESAAKTEKTVINNNNVADDTKATEILNRLIKIWPGEGKEGKWEIDTSSLLTWKIEKSQKLSTLLLPSKATQQHLIQVYFKHCYSTFPMIPKKLFYKHFETNNTLLLASPILLFMIFAHGGQYQQMEEADIYFKHAKTLLFEEGGEMNYPSLSTIIALVLMSLYEETGNNSNQSMYSAMAFQMCRDLNLIRNYSSGGGATTTTTNIELKKRICWSCYYLDKLLHIQSGQPWILKSKDIELDMPLLQPGDDVTEHEILEGFVATIKLLQIAERILQPLQQPVIVIETHHDQISLNSDNELLHWLRSLPSHLQWTPPLLVNNQPTMPDPPSNSMQCHIHLIYNVIELSVLKPYASSTAKSIHRRSISIATNITRLISTLSENTTWIFNTIWTTNALFESTKIHLGNCTCENLVLARHARFMFQHALQAMKSFVLLDQKRNSITPKITLFLTALDQALTDADGEMMTPFVLGSLNPRGGHDYFSNGLMTPPTVKSKSTSFTAAPAAGLYYQQYPVMSTTTNYHSAMTDTTNLFSTNMSPYNTNFLSSWHHRKPSSPVNNHSHPNRSAAASATAELISTDPTDIEALVAQIKTSTNNSNTNPPSHHHHSQDLLYSLLSDQQERPTTTPATTVEPSPPPPRYNYPTYMNVGLGIYASAHQHHNDVIRQHLPTNNTPSSTILTHQGQVIHQ